MIIVLKKNFEHHNILPSIPRDYHDYIYFDNKFSYNITVITVLSFTQKP